MTLYGFIALAIFVSIIVLAFIEIAGMPGRSARERNHPEADAIALLGWLGLPLGVLPWLVAMIWARMQHNSVSVVNATPEIKTTTAEDADDDSSTV